MKILFLTDNFPPEVNAPASRTYEHVVQWHKAGHDITVITCVPNFPQGKVYEGYKNRLCQVEYVSGIKVIRVWSYIAANKGIAKRTLDYVSYAISAFIAGLFQKTDVIIATSPQFFTALSGRVLSTCKRIPWIMEVRDLWPESIKTVDVMKDNAVIRYFERKEIKCYKSASRIVVVTDSFKRTLIARGIPENKIAVVKNGVNVELFRPMSKDLALIKTLGLEGKKIIGYIGTHGMAHKLDFILKCAKDMQGANNYHFLFIGSGAEKQHLLELKHQLHIDNVTMLDPVPKEEVNKYISILDVALINLRKSPGFKAVIPSKIFENAGMEIPILMGVEGEAQEIIERYGAGLCFEPENEKDFMEKLSLLLSDLSIYKKCKEGCKKLVMDFDRKKLAADMLMVIKDVHQNG